MSSFSLPVRIYHEDTDGGGIVYYANYLKFMERARTEYLRFLGFEQDQLLRDSGCLFVVTTCNISYLQPARFNDLLRVSAEPTVWRRASMEFQQNVSRAERSCADQTETKAGSETESNVGSDTESGIGSTLLCKATVQLACLDSKTFKPSAMPSEMRRAFN